MSWRISTKGAARWTLALGAGGLLATLGSRAVLAELVDPNDPLPPVGSEGGPSIPLNVSAEETWLAGRLVFDRDFHLADGLGTPDLNGDSCRSCHQDPVVGGAGGLDVNVFRYGGEDMGGAFMDLPGGQVASKLCRADSGPRDEHDPSATIFEQRQTPTTLGLGAIDSIFPSSILFHQDPTDADADGIFGVARMVPVASGPMEVGRFGWKAQIPTLRDFIHDAMGGELGITVIDDGRGFGMLTDADAIADPELSQEDEDDLHFFMSHLAPPPRGGDEGDPEVQLGESLFTSVGCAICHVPSLAGVAGPVPLYSNLLLHDVLPTDFRGMAEPGAGEGLYRTPPLWGISKTAPYFHDGRAETLLDAVLMHESEAENVRVAFEALTQAEQDALIRFLMDL